MWVDTAELGTLEEFLRHYHFLKKPSECPVNSKLVLFRADCTPCWESWPRSGCFLLQYDSRKESHLLQLDKQWQRLLFNLVGESLHPSVIGASLCKRERITVVELWLCTSQHRDQVFELLVERVPDLRAEDLRFKMHSESIKVRRSQPRTTPP